MKGCEKKLEEVDKKGRRGGCRQKYLDIVEKIRETKPDMDICENQWERLINSLDFSANLSEKPFLSNHLGLATQNG